MFSKIVLQYIQHCCMIMLKFKQSLIAAAAMEGGLRIIMSALNRIKFILASVVLTAVILIAPISARAAVNNPTPVAKVSFTFDDGFASARTIAAPTLAKYGLAGTSYVITGCVGMTTVPNTCRANNNTRYLTWAQINQLKNTYGWEIGSHTVNHPLLASTDPEDQPQKLTPAQVTAELTQSKATLAAQGINATSFASSYGDYDMPVLAEVAKHYSSHRGFADTGYNSHPYSEYIVRDQQVQENVSVATVKSYIDQAIASKSWLVLTFHDIKGSSTANPDDYDYSTNRLDQIAAYVKTKQTAGQIQSSNISKNLVTSDTNMLANASFNSGIASGWTTDAPANITKDTANNGNYPDPTNAAKFVATNRNIHLFSQKVSVDPNASYLLKNYLNVKTLTSGEVSFYIDEYDAVGNWISGQYKVAERSVFVEELNFNYKPSSAAVKQASLQIGVTANSGITAYVDNVQWFPTTAVAPPPVQQNLMVNGTFDNGIADGWRTDSSSTMVKDSSNNGSPANPVNSVKMTATTSNTHLFSPFLLVDSTKTYSLFSYLDVKQRTSGEVGFYIDEYDANGNWISGQWKTGVMTLGSREVAYNYKPSSANVKQASLQVGVSANSGITAYFDDVRWYLN